MSNCCHKTSKQTSLACPNCGALSQLVSLQTVLHQVKFPQNRQLKTEPYYFCATLDCFIGYFSVVDQITQQNLIANSPIKINLLCYCFDISIDDYQSALVNHTSKIIKDFVTDNTKKGRCACEIKNPSGRCCLTQFKQLEDSKKTLA
jgi:hypothetical protein